MASVLGHDGGRGKRENGQGNARVRSPSSISGKRARGEGCDGQGRVLVGKMEREGPGTYLGPWLEQGGGGAGRPWEAGAAGGAGSRR